MHVGTKVRAVYDNTGAGDAVLAMLAGALAAGGDFVEAVRLANVAGGLEVEKFGCVPILREEVIADLRLDHQSLSGKLRTAEQLAAELSLLRDRGQTIVFTNGCFDLLHPGHLDFFGRCQALGSVVVVGVNSDASVRSLDKGGNRPYVNEQDRARMLAGLADVDYVTIFGESDPEKLIRKVRPDVLVKGQDWSEKGVVGREFVESYGGRVELLELLEGYSTTALAERIRGEGN
jgi:D-beta-D-heptose 7-phosphate kinase/D-beta-D-heptose 1-phosphate adenosyltransferase